MTWNDKWGLIKQFWDHVWTANNSHQLDAERSQVYSRHQKKGRLHHCHHLLESRPVKITAGEPYCQTHVSKQTWSDTLQPRQTLWTCWYQYFVWAIIHSPVLISSQDNACFIILNREDETHSVAALNYNKVQTVWPCRPLLSQNLRLSCVFTDSARTLQGVKHITHTVQS